MGGSPGFVKKIGSKINFYILSVLVLQPLTTFGGGRQSLISLFSSDVCTLYIMTRVSMLNDAAGISQCTWQFTEGVLMVCFKGGALSGLQLEFG